MNPLLPVMIPLMLALFGCANQPVKPVEPQVIERTVSCVAAQGKPIVPMLHSDTELLGLNYHDYPVAVTADRLAARQWVEELEAATSACK